MVPRLSAWKRLMISTFRSYLNTWVVRGLFLVLVAAFALWGVGDVIRNMGDDTWVAKVGGRTIEPPELQEAFRGALAQYSRNQSGAEPNAMMRVQIASQTLESLILRTAVDELVRRMHVLVSDAALRESVFTIPAFRGPNGAFDRQVFETVLRNNNLTEARFLVLQRDDLARRQLLEPVSAGVAVPDVLTRQAFDYRDERRAADMVEFPFAAVTPPLPPDAAILTRWYDNHPWLYSTPEYRRIKAVILAPQTLAKEIPVTDAELQTAYDQHKEAYVQPEKRSVQVLVINDEAKARALADKWRNGADWAAIQAAAKADGGSPVELDAATGPEIPDPDLAKAVFAAVPQTVSDPIHGALGWQVFRVTAMTPGSERTFDQVKDELRDKLIAERAADLMYDRANKLDNILATGASLDEIPADLGLAAVAGTLDADGMTADGSPAPIPGPPELRTALVKAAFQLQPGDPPHLVEVQTPQEGGSAYYAMQVESIVPPAPRPYDEVKDKVLADWTQDQVRRVQNVAASNLLAAINKGQSIADAALVAGATMRHSPLVDRSNPTEGMPPALQNVLFGSKKGEAMEVETPDGFVTAVLTEIKEPDPNDDKAGYTQVRDRLNRETADDVGQIFANALRARASPRINQSTVEQIAQP
jgi:peptidyl-prolyl cis-trans isomerase D